MNKIRIPAEYGILVFGILISLVIIIWRIDLAYGYDPTLIIPEERQPFYPDEISYYCGTSIKSFSLGDFLKSFLQGYPMSINLWGNFIYFLKEYGIKWYYLFFIGIFFYILFGIVLIKILSLLMGNSIDRLFLYLIIMLHPGILQIASSWLRDIVVITLLLFSLCSLLKKKPFSFFLSTLMILFLRSYMVVINIFLLLFLINKNRKRAFLISGGIIIVTIFYFLVQPYGIIYLKQFGQKFIPRLIENFSGINLWLFQGKIIPNGGLMDLEVWATYYYVLTYFCLYVYIIFKKRIKFRYVLESQLFLSTVFTGLFITILHSMIFGFFVSRIKLLTWIMFVISTASIVGNKEKMKGDLDETFIYS
ncbi:hypothetical protein JCM16816_07790 [Thermoanaerobacter brockii subsp. lactiethylicus]